MGKGLIWLSGQSPTLALSGKNFAHYLAPRRARSYKTSRFSASLMLPNAVGRHFNIASNFRFSYTEELKHPFPVGPLARLPNFRKETGCSGVARVGR